MAAGQGLELLATQRVTRVLTELEAQTDVPQDLIWLNRAATRPAMDGELMARYHGDVLISDIITADAVATIKDADTIVTETNTIPKIKHGARINETMIKLLRRLESGSAISDDRLTVRGYLANKLGKILLGIRQRKNMILAAMHLDDFDYRMGGVVISNATWGMPSDLKFDVAIDWTTANASTMTPIWDITTATRYAYQQYGVRFNRITMSLVAFDAIVGCAEFKAKAELYSQRAFPAGSFPMLNEIGPQLSLLVTMLNSGGQNFTIEFEDSRYKDQQPDGQITRHRYWPDNKVLIDSTSSDNNQNDYFLGQDIVPETEIASLATVGGMQGAFGGAQRGPVAWVEVPGLNPPNVNIWGADQCWPVRVEIQKEILMTVF